MNAVDWYKEPAKTRAVSMLATIDILNRLDNIMMARNLQFDNGFTEFLNNKNWGALYRSFCGANSKTENPKSTGFSLLRIISEQDSHDLYASYLANTMECRIIPPPPYYNFSLWAEQKTNSQNTIGIHEVTSGTKVRQGPNFQ